MGLPPNFLTLGPEGGKDRPVPRNRCLRVCRLPRWALMAAALPLTAMQDKYGLTLGESTRKAYQNELERRQTL